LQLALQVLGLAQKLAPTLEQTLEQTLARSLEPKLEPKAQLELAMVQEHTRIAAELAQL